MTATHTPKKSFWTQGTTIAVILIAGLLIIGIVFAVAMNVSGDDDDHRPLTLSEERRMNELLDEGKQSITETAFVITWEGATWEEKDAMCNIYGISPEFAYETVLSSVSSVTAREFSFQWFDNFLSRNC